MKSQSHLSAINALLVVAVLSVHCTPAALGEETSVDSRSIKTNHPDIVLIVVDDLNDWIGVMNGHPQSLTPNMDAFAKQGILTVGFYGPHRPLNAPKKYFDKFPTDRVKLPALPEGDDWDDLPPYATALARSHAHRKFHQGKYSDHEEMIRIGGEAEWKYTVGSYLACVNYVDTQIGLVDALQQKVCNQFAPEKT